MGTNELDRVVAAMKALSKILTPSPIQNSVVGTAADLYVIDFRGWINLLALRWSHFNCMDIWSHRHPKALVKIEESVVDVLKDDTLLHFDIRAGNILLTPRRVWFLDWSQACVGPSWLDVVAFAPSVTMQGGPPPEDIIMRHSACRGAEKSAITAAVVAIADTSPTKPCCLLLQACQQYGQSSRHKVWSLESGFHNVRDSYRWLELEEADVHSRQPCRASDYSIMRGRRKQINLRSVV